MRNVTKLMIVATLALVLSVSIIYAVTQISYYMPQTATVPTYSLQTYVNGLPWSNGTSVDWGTISTVNNKSLNIKNIGNTPVTVYLFTSILPSGWSETWSENATLISPNNWANGTLTLTRPSDALNGTYNWQSWIMADA